MSAFTEPLAQVRRGIAEPHRANNRHEYQAALAALAQVERLATEYEAHLRNALRAYDSIDQGTRNDAKMGYPLPGDSCTYVALALHADETFAEIRAVLSAREEGAQDE